MKATFMQGFYKTEMQNSHVAQFKSTEIRFFR